MARGACLSLRSTTLTLQVLVPAQCRLEFSLASWAIRPLATRQRIALIASALAFIDQERQGENRSPSEAVEGLLINYAELILGVTVARLLQHLAISQSFSAPGGAGGEGRRKARTSNNSRKGIISTQEQADWLVAVEMFALIDGPKNEPGRPELGRATACKAATAQENVAMEHL